MSMSQEYCYQIYMLNRLQPHLRYGLYYFKFVEIPLLNVVLIPIKGENDLDILENCK